MLKLAEISTKFELSPTLHANEMVALRRAEGQQVLHMGFGESSFPVPERLRQALRDNADQNQYLPTGGLPELCKMVAQYYKDKVGLDTDQFDVFIAPGSKLVLYSLQRAIEGDLLVPNPSWVSYAPQARMLKTDVITIPTHLSDAGLYIDPLVFQDVIDKARSQGQNPRKIILNYPSNPTGLTMTEDNLKDLAAICVKEDILIISDEIYGFVNFDGHYRTIAKYAPSHTAVSTGASKHLALGGWRLGIGFIPKSLDGLYGRLCNIASETWSCVATPVQKAVIEAYKGHEDIETHIRDCAVLHGFINRYISAGLRDAGLEAPTVQGAFYNYPNFDHYREELARIDVLTSENLSSHLLNHYGLASLPAAAFGGEPDDLKLRLSGCDYNGTKALAAYREGEALDDVFIEKHTPNIKAQVDVFKEFILKIS